MEKQNVYDVLVERGLVAQTTNAEKTRELFGSEKVSFYVGFDATADSLHIGHFLPIILMMHLQRAGHYPIALMGTGTTLVGDPTGKTEMRKMLTVDEINHNADNFARQISKYVTLDGQKGEIVKNGDWLLELKYLPFLRDIGIHFSVNRMLTAECFKSRLEKGLSFIEFNYMIMQSYDFLHLHQEKNVKVEFGGDDQWSNIIGGVDLTRRVTGDEVYGLTMPLLVKADGQKMGKTAGGAVWLDPERYSPYDFFQYFRNCDDADVTTLFTRLTFVPMDEIREMETWQGTSRINEAKERLAYEITAIIHGEDEAKKAMETARAIFINGQDDANMPTTELSSGDFTDGSIGILDLLVKADLAASKSEARRLVQQGGISVNGDKVAEENATFEEELFKGDGLTVKKGKKVFQKVLVK